MKLLEVVNLQTSGCKKCFTATYTLPCEIDNSLASFFLVFGKPVYNINVVKLLKIVRDDGLKIEGKIGTKQIKLNFLKNKIDNIHKSPLKIQFEKCLSEWLSKTLKIKITP